MIQVSSVAAEPESKEFTCTKLMSIDMVFLFSLQTPFINMESVSLRIHCDSDGDVCLLKHAVPRYH